jgi:hypothetical protein
MASEHPALKLERYIAEAQREMAARRSESIGFFRNKLLALLRDKSGSGHADLAEVLGSSYRWDDEFDRPIASFEARGVTFRIWHTVGERSPEQQQLDLFARMHAEQQGLEFEEAEEFPLTWHLDTEEAEGVLDADWFYDAAELLVLIGNYAASA